MNNVQLLSLILLVAFSSCTKPISIQESEGEKLYKQLSEWALDGQNEQIEALNVKPRQLDWIAGSQMDFKGHLRYLNSSREGNLDQSRLFFIRSAAEGDVYILNIPDREDPDYAGLEELMENKLIFSILVMEAEVEGQTYQFAQFIDYPVQPAFDKIFRLAIILMLFLVMVGMGLTLTGKDFVVLVTKPKGIIIGEILQFGIMPLVAVAF